MNAVHMCGHEGRIGLESLSALDVFVVQEKAKLIKCYDCMVDGYQNGNCMTTTHTKLNLSEFDPGKYSPRSCAWGDYNRLQRILNAGPEYAIEIIKKAPSMMHPSFWIETRKLWDKEFLEKINRYVEGKVEYVSNFYI